jgi:hypothetical protein
VASAGPAIECDFNQPRGRSQKEAYHSPRFAVLLYRIGSTSLKCVSDHRAALVTRYGHDGVPIRRGESLASFIEFELEIANVHTAPLRIQPCCLRSGSLELLRLPPSIPAYWTVLLALKKPESVEL